MERLHRWKRLFSGFRRRRFHTNIVFQRQVPLSNPSWHPPLFFLNNIADTVMRQPRCLQNVDCTQLLTGGSTHYENFSSTCWLEDHLHHFGEASSFREIILAPEYSSHYCAAEDEDCNPPPYDDEPPPSYEEAIAVAQHCDTDNLHSENLWF